MKRSLQAARVEISVLSGQVQKATRDNLAIKQELDTLRNVVSVVSARVKVVENKAFKPMHK